jgi:hypothetical protein
MAAEAYLPARTLGIEAVTGPFFHASHCPQATHQKEFSTEGKLRLPLSMRLSSSPKVPPWLPG